MISRYLIYGLVDPGSGQLRYVGKSCSGLERPRAHCSPARLREKNHKANWLRVLVGEGKKPEVVVFQEFDCADVLSQAEMFWIAYFRKMGCRLTNGTDGGDGASKGRVLPESQRLAIVASNRTRKVSEETRARMRDAKVGKDFLADNLRKGPESLRGRKQSAELVQKRTAARLMAVVDQNDTVYPSIKDASSILGIPSGCISRVVNGKRSHTHGYTFRFLERANG